MSHLPQQQLKFSKEINISSYAEYTKHDRVLNQYCQWCIDCAGKKWSDEYLNFTFVINNLLRNNKNFADLGNISTAVKNKIYCIIKKY